MAEPNGAARVVVVVSHLGLGGAERQTLELLRQLRGTAWAPVRVICLSANVTPHGDDRARARLPPVDRLAEPADSISDAGVRSAVLSDRRTPTWFTPSIGSRADTAFWRSPRRARIISSIRNSHLPAGRVRRFALPLLIRRAAGVLVNSERGRQLVVRTCKVPPGRVALVPNGIDVDLLRNAAIPGTFRRELNIPPGSPVVAYVGRNARVKNIPRLLSVARKLLQANPDVRIVLAGEGLDPRLVAGTDLAAVPRLHCLGPRGDIPSLLCDATVLLLTSDSEGMPNVVLEALGSGVPVVATAVGDLAHILPERCGALVPPDTEQLVSAVLHVIGEAPAYRRAVEQHAAHIRATHSLQAMAAGTVDVWRRAARRARNDMVPSSRPEHGDRLTHSF